MGHHLQLVVWWGDSGGVQITSTMVGLFIRSGRPPHLMLTKQLLSGRFPWE